MRIGYFQFGTTNPYQEKYFQAVRDAGGDVTALQFSSILSAKQLASYDILHLDWLHPFYKSRRGRFVQWLKIQNSVSTLRKLRKRGHTKIVHTVHNLLSHDSFLSEAAERKVIQRLLDQVDAFAVFSQPVFDRLRSEFTVHTHQQHFLTPHGHYIDSYALPTNRGVCRRQLGLPLDEPIVLFFGSLRENKGVLDLIEVFPAVHEQTGALLVVAGDQPSERVAEALRAAHHSVLAFSGGVAEEEVGSYFAASDLTALPFRSVLNSGTAILAASMAKFAVFPKIPSVYANLNQQAIATFTPCDKQSLADALLKALAIPSDQRDRLGQLAREHVQRNLSWERTGQLAMQMYQQLHAGTPSVATLSESNSSTESKPCA